MNFYAKTFDELTAAELYEILKARARVFMIEQKIFYLDMDDTDYGSLHCYFMDGGQVSAYLRAYRIGEGAVKIGRVLTLRHGRGDGRALIEQSISEIRRRINCKIICVDAQKHAAGFYKKLGFSVTSGDFLEAGVVHIAMELKLE